MSSYRGQEFNGAAHVPSAVAETPSNLGNCTDLNSLCYNSITEQGQMFRIAAARGRYGSKFDGLSMLSISAGISIDPVETVESGEMVDSNNRQQTCGFGANRMKSKWGRSSVG
jgi:hypothetical protein